MASMNLIIIYCDDYDNISNCHDVADEDESYLLWFWLWWWWLMTMIWDYDDHDSEEYDDDHDHDKWVWLCIVLYCTGRLPLNVVFQVDVIILYSTVHCTMYGTCTVYMQMYPMMM